MLSQQEKRNQERYSTQLLLSQDDPNKLVLCLTFVKRWPQMYAVHWHLEPAKCTNRIKSCDVRWVQEYNENGCDVVHCVSLAFGKPRAKELGELVPKALS